MSGKAKKGKRGVTLIEIIVAMTVTIVAIIGAIGYRYYSILDARKAKVQITAGRVGSMLLECWRGSGGRSEPDSGTFDPVDFSYSTVLELSGGGKVNYTGLDDFTHFGSYAVIADGATYYVSLAYKDEAANVRVLNASVFWPRDYPSGEFVSGGDSVSVSTKVKPATY